MSARRIIIIVIIIVVIVGAGVFLFNQFGSGSQDSAAEPTPGPVINVSTAVQPEGRVVPVRHTNLAFRTGGIVDEILAEEGQVVEEGEPLIRLEAVAQEDALAEAQAALAVAEAQQESAAAQLSAAETSVANAELGVLAAEANLALVKAGALPEEIAAAEQDIAAARSGLTQAAASRDATLDIPDSQIRSAEANVAAARAEVDALQDAYDRIIDACFDIPGGDTICPLYGTVEENTRADLETARLRLNSAQAALDALNAGATSGQRQAAGGSVSIASANVDLAEAQLDLLLAGPTEEEVRQAEIQVEQARAAVEQAQTAVGQAQAASTQAEAGVKSAESGVAAAQAALDRTVLRAVFPGSVGQIDVELGQLVSPGVPVVVLADLSDWLLETSDLSELDIARVEVGAPATIVLEAIQDETLTGTVTKIALVVDRRLGGDALYTVTIDLDDRPDLPLRWGMTTDTVEIEAD